VANTSRSSTIRNICRFRLCTAHKSPAHCLYFRFISAAAVLNSGLHNPASAMQAPASTARSAVPCRQPRPFQAALRRSAGTFCAPTCVSLCLSPATSALHGIAAPVQSRSGLICTSKVVAATGRVYLGVRVRATRHSRIPMRS